ncbi:MAG TPA: hypothetical protein VGE09_08770 [Pseudoxanthomonas sp.]
MSADWIKMRTDLYRDPKVCVIADALLASDGELARYVSQMNQCDMSVTRNVTRNATVGALVTVWGVMRHRGKRVDVDLVCRGVSLWIVDDVADMPGFGAALASVGWVIETSEGIVFPSFFDEYNVDPSEKKATSSADRQRRYRESKKQKSDVTRDVTRDVTVTHREEKSREEKEEQAAEITIPLEDGTEHPVTASEVSEYRAAYPRIDVMGELRKARAWCFANPAQRKTRRGVGKFVNGWLSRADADKAKAAPQPARQRQVL